MFLTCIVRPRFYEEDNYVFDGKLGIFLFCKSTLAKRSSADTPAGTVITKIMNETQNVIKRMLVEQLLLAIKKKMAQ
jgi:hypothetical protein